MGKMFVHYSGSIDDFKQYYSSLTEEEQVAIDKKIVFINGVSKTASTSNEGDEAEDLSIVSAIYTHGEFYASAADLSENLSDLKEKLDGLQGDFDEVIGDGLKYISSITVNSDPSTAKNANAGSNLDLSVVNESATYSDKNIIAATMGLLGFQLTVSDELNQAVIDSHTHANKALLDSIDDTKVEKWNSAQANVIETVKVNGVVLTPDADKAVDVVFEIPEAPVTDVKSDDKVLSLTDGVLSSSIRFSEGKHTFEGKTEEEDALILYGKDDAVLGAIPTSKFVADGMLQNVELEGNNLVFTFNVEVDPDGEDGEKEPTKTIKVDLSDYIDAYSEGIGININDSNVISVELDSDSESFLSVSASGLKLSGVQDAINAAIGDVNIEAEGDGYVVASAANNKVSVSASLKTKDAVTLAETALQEVTKEDSDYATVTVSNKTEEHKQSVKVDVKVQAVASASAAKQGLADANDVRLEIAGAKSYADDLFAWEEL